MAKKKPFSGKQKKAQLAARRARKQGVADAPPAPPAVPEEPAPSPIGAANDASKFQLRLHGRESKAAVMERVKDASRPLEPLSPLVVRPEDFHDVGGCGGAACCATHVPTLR